MKTLETYAYNMHVYANIQIYYCNIQMKTLAIYI
jgi:hypothetical protein